MTCDECNGSGYEVLLNFWDICGVCMPTDEDENLTPAATPNAKKSSGAWSFKFNAPDAICGRAGCTQRRDEHEAETTGKAGRCTLCDCPGYVAGGPDYDSLADTLPTDPDSGP